MKQFTVDCGTSQKKRGTSFTEFTFFSFSWNRLPAVPSSQIEMEWGGRYWGKNPYYLPQVTTLIGKKSSSCYHDHINKSQEIQEPSPGDPPKKSTAMPWVSLKICACRMPWCTCHDVHACNTLVLCLFVLPLQISKKVVTVISLFVMTQWAPVWCPDIKLEPYCKCWESNVWLGGKGNGRRKPSEGCGELGTGGNTGKSCLYEACALNC